MYKFYIKVAVYLIAYLVSLYGLGAFDFNRFIKKGRVAQAQVLYVCISLIMAYLLGNFFMAVIYYFN